MKTTNHFSLLLLICLLTFVSCKKEENQPAINEFMNGQVDGKAFKASTFVIARAGITTSINGTIGPASNPESIGLSIQNAKVGTFTFSEDGADFAVYNSATEEYISMLGTLQITAMSQEWIEGNFSFMAHSINNPARHITVSSGEFKMRFD